MSNTKTYLTSNTLYTHTKHAHWLEEVNIVGLKRKLSSYENNIMGGWSLKSKNEAFSESAEYNHLIHELDLVSGEYVDVIKPYARKLIKQQLEENGIAYDATDLQWTTNFSSSTKNTIENRKSGEYYAQGYYYFDLKNGQLTVSFKDAEAFAYTEQKEV
ncbi:hypothetical protein [Psychrobacter pygoscelis]|uniref:hypothetical protein n=1 Tax=Psychrobacter pygoscelis TaxID=2488563 RepID=UPI00103C0DED|nr:hypothetical protein [Psychrobacter pygoscelis]